MHHLLENIVKETHRGLSLTSRAIAEFRRFFDHPDTALKSYAYVLLSNWFLTDSGDRNSMVASRCEALWDELFPAAPWRDCRRLLLGRTTLFWLRNSTAFGLGSRRLRAWMRMSV